MLKAKLNKSKSDEPKQGGPSSKGNVPTHKSFPLKGTKKLFDRAAEWISTKRKGLVNPQKERLTNRC